MFVGWEGVGLASYLLIGFYFQKDSAANAGKKAFIVNRIGDFGFLLAMFLLIQHFGTLSFGDVFASSASIRSGRAASSPRSASACWSGAAGKSAQIPLYVWLPDAMEGPTPVSALIHAATMVTAGVYMVARCHTLFDRSPIALDCSRHHRCGDGYFRGVDRDGAARHQACAGVLDGLAAGLYVPGLRRRGVSAGIFHLLTHAFFKALLFLAAGSVIHALSGEQDMRKMGGSAHKIPITFWTMTAAALRHLRHPALRRLLLEGRDSVSDVRLAAAGGKFLWFVGLVTAGMTSFYMFRLWFMTFFGEPHFEPAHTRITPASMRRSSHYH